MVLGMLFYRYISENMTDYINRGEHEAGNKDFDYAKLSYKDAEVARADLVQTRGFFILPSELFQSLRKKFAMKILILGIKFNLCRRRFLI